MNTDNKAVKIDTNNPESPQVIMDLSELSGMEKFSQELSKQASDLPKQYYLMFFDLIESLNQASMVITTLVREVKARQESSAKEFSLRRASEAVWKGRYDNVIEGRRLIKQKLTAMSPLLNNAAEEGGQFIGLIQPIINLHYEILRLIQSFEEGPNNYE